MEVDVQGRLISLGDLTHTDITERYLSRFRTEANAPAFQVAFRHCGVRKLRGSIIGNNVGSVKSYTRWGWHVECVRKHQYLIEGVLQDEIFVGCFNPDARSSQP